MLRYPGVYVVHNPGVGQVGAIKLSPVAAPAFADKVLINSAVGADPQAVGDGELSGAAQLAAVQQQLGPGGVQLLLVRAATSDRLKLSQGVPVRPVGRHGQGHCRGKGGDQG